MKKNVPVSKILAVGNILLVLGVLLFCTGMAFEPLNDTVQTIPYEESRMAEFSKGLRETKEIYVEWSNGNIKTAIDMQSGNEYEEENQDKTVKRMFFQNKSNKQTPEGVYELLEKSQVPCYFPIESDAIIDMYKLLVGMNDSCAETVQVSCDGANRKETIVVGEETRTMLFLGDTSTPISIGVKNDMEDFTITFNLFAEKIPNEDMKTALKNGLKGRSLYIPPYDCK